MEAILSAIGSFGTLAAESVSASEARRAQILSEVEATYRTYREGLEGFWKGLAADDKEMADLARPLPAASPAPTAPSTSTPDTATGGGVA